MIYKDLKRTLPFGKALEKDSFALWFLAPVWLWVWTKPNFEKCVEKVQIYRDNGRSDVFETYDSGFRELNFTYLVSIDKYSAQTC